jgi:hypothetical protein
LRSNGERQEILVFGNDDPATRNRIVPDSAVGSTIKHSISHVLTIETLGRKKPRESGRQLLIYGEFHADRTTGCSV